MEEPSTLKFIFRRQCENNLMHFFASRRGFFFGEDILQRVLPFTIVRLTLFSIITQVLRFLLIKPLKQTEFVCNLLTGIILGPSVLGRFYKSYKIVTDRPSQLQFINVGAYISVIYYVFLIGVKTDFGVLRRSGKKVWVIGLTSFFTSFFVMASLNDLLHPITFKSPFLVFVFTLQHSTTWFANLAPMLEELNLLTTEMGQLALALSMTNEVVSWCFWMYLMLTYLFGMRGFYNGVLPLCLIVGSTLFALRPALKWLIKVKVPHGEPVKEVYVIGIFSGVIIMSLISDIVAGSPVIGVAFLGLVIPSGPPLGTVIQERSEMFVKNCLLPFFYLAVGDMTDVYGIKDLKGHLGYQAIFIIGYCIKTLVIVIAAKFYNMTPRLGLALGLAMNTSGVLNTMVFLSYTLRQTMFSNQASHLVLNSLVVTALVTPLAWYLHRERSSKSGNSTQGLDLSFLALSETSKLQILACVDSEDDIAGIISLLNAAHPTESHPMTVYVVHLTELCGQVTPVLMVHKEHQRLCDYNGCVHITSALNNFCENSKGGVNIQLLTMITPFKSIHEGICFLAEDKMIPLIIVPFNYKSQGEFTRNYSSDLNRKLQSLSPSTVGILVHRDEASKQWNRNRHSKFTYRVAVFFFGGEDDREALAYATRMSRHRRVCITMIHIVIKEFSHVSKTEKKLDELRVDLFKTRVIGKARAPVFQEIHVEDWIRALDVVRSLDNNYDLVMVGGRHGETASDDQDSSVLCENPELGLIGEIFVCNELQWRNSSVLVMQHCSNVGRDGIDHLKLSEGVV